MSGEKSLNLPQNSLILVLLKFFTLQFENLYQEYQIQYHQFCYGDVTNDVTNIITNIIKLFYAIKTVNKLQYLFHRQ